MSTLFRSIVGAARALFRRGPRLPEGPLDIRTAVPELFDPLVGQTVMARQEGVEMPLRLVHVKRGNPPIAGVRARPSFTLVFIGDEAPAHPYGALVTLEFPTLGSLEAVSINPNSGPGQPEWGEGQLWSAVFG